MNARGVCFWPRSFMARAWQIIGPWWDFSRLHGRDSVDARLELLPSAVLQRMILCGLLGMTVFSFAATVGRDSGKMPITFWETLEANLIPQYSVLKAYFFYCLYPMNHLEFLALLLAYLMPLFMMAIHWNRRSATTIQLA